MLWMKGTEMLYRDIRLWVLITLGMVATTATAATCPESLGVAGAGPLLVNASVYDGQPGEMAQLVPSTDDDLDRWDVRLKDPYLVCRFQGTLQVVSLHAVGATSCEAGLKPFRASCQP